MKIKICRYTFSNGDVINYSPTEEVIVKIICDFMGWESLPAKYNIRNYYKDNFFAESTIKDIFADISGEILLSDLPIEEIVKELSKLISIVLMTTNAIYNDVGFESLDYMYTLSLNDMIEIVSDERLVDAIKYLANNPTQDAVLNVYKVMDTVMRDEKYRDNKVALAYISNIVNQMQMKQCFGTRGFVINMDGVINKYPVVSNYMLGLYDNYEYILDSKSAAVALYYSISAIQQSETFSNMLQTAALIVENISYKDCGTTETLEYVVQGPGLNIHGEYYKGDLKALTGMKYKLNKDDKDWLLFKGDEKHLYNKKIYLRLPYHCKHSNPHTICVHCLGRYALHAKPSYNIGMYITSRLSDLLNQSVLSAKHLISSAIVDKLVLTKEAREFFIQDEKYLKLNPKYVNKDMVLKVSLKEFYGYKDLEDRDLQTINHHKLSKVRSLIFKIDDKIYPVTISTSNKFGIFTKDFIYYLRKNVIKVDDKLILHVNMKRWKSSYKLMEIPESMFDARAYGAAIRSFMSGGKGSNLGSMNRDSFIVELHNLISRKFTVSFTTLGLIAYIMGLKDPNRGNYRIARNTDKYKMVSINTVISKTSITGAYTTGKISPLNRINLSDPYGKHDHLLDLYLAPQEVVELEREGYFERGD